MYFHPLLFLLFPQYMKMMGVNPLSHFFAWFLECAAYLVLTIFILTLVLKYGSILPNSDGFLLFLFLCDYSLSVLAFSYLVSSFFDKTYIAGLPLLNRDTAVIRQCVLCVCWDYEGILLYSVDNRNSQVSKITDIIQNRFSYFHHSTLSKYFPTYPNLKSQSIAKTQNANKISSRKDKKCHT